MRKIYALLTVLGTLLAVTLTAAPAQAVIDDGTCATHTIRIGNTTRVCVRAWYNPQTDGDGGANVTKIRVGLHADDIGPDCDFMEDTGMILNDYLDIHSRVTGSIRWSATDFKVNGNYGISGPWCERYFTFSTPVAVDRGATVQFYYVLRVNNYPDPENVITLVLP